MLSPSPHHLACGSPSAGSGQAHLGRSQSLPNRSWVVNFHPQFFDRHKTLILKPLVSHAGLGRHGSRTSPGAFSCQAHGNSYTRMGAEPEKVANFCADVAPLLPIAHAHAPSQPMIYFRNRSIVLRYSKVVHPAANILSKLLISVFHRYKPASAGQVFNPPFELTETPLPSANTFVNILKTLTLTGFTYRELSPHKFTPMPSVHKTVQVTTKAEFALSKAFVA